MCVILIHIIHILQGSGQSFIIACVHLSDRSVPKATDAAKYHAPGCTARAPLFSCLLKLYYYANNIQQIIQRFNFNDLSSEGPYSTYEIRDDCICGSISLRPQELKSWAEAKQM